MVTTLTGSGAQGKCCEPGTSRATLVLHLHGNTECGGHLRASGSTASKLRNSESTVHGLMQVHVSTVFKRLKKKNVD